MIANDSLQTGIMMLLLVLIIFNDAVITRQTKTTQV